MDYGLPDWLCVMWEDICCKIFTQVFVSFNIKSIHFGNRFKGFSDATNADFK